MSKAISILRALPLAAAMLFPAAAIAAETASHCAANLPTPYRAVPDWASLPAGRTWGSASAVTVDAKGDIWVADRCGANSCADSPLAPIFEFDRNGKLLANFGAGLFAQPHSIMVDKAGDIWVTDDQGAPGKGQQVLKFSPDGKVLMRLGTAGVAGPELTAFDQPTSVAIAPNGDIMVSEGHTPTNGNSRIMVFSKDGKFLRTWGHKGTGPTDMLGPHALIYDKRGRLLVADRGNSRILIYSPGGDLVAQWSQFGIPTALFIDAKDNLYVADSGSTEQTNPGCARGIRIGSAKDGTVTGFIPGPPTVGPTSGAEGVAVGQDGAVYGAEVLGKAVQKYVRGN